MLIFVDKKKEKQRKIKILCIFFGAIFLLIANILHFQEALFHNAEKLTDYHSHKISNNWYNKADVIYLLTSHNNQQTKVILLPSNFNRENATTLALAFSKLPQKETHIHFTDEISNQKDIKNLASLFLPITSKHSAEQQLLISSDFEKVEKDIQQNHLYPLVLNYKHAQKLTHLNKLTQQLDELFPPVPIPQNKLEENKINIQKFAAENLPTIKNIIFHNQTPSFALQNIFSGNIRFCLKSESNNKCNFSTHNSFARNLQKTADKFSLQDIPQKLILLTDDMPISTEDYQNIASDEGLHFIFNNHKTFLFPEEIISLADKQKALYILKEKAGLNPEYQSDDMKLYKFKTLEIDLDDNI